MGEPGCTDTAPIWPIGPITVKVKEEEFGSSLDASPAQLTKPDRRPFLLSVLRWRRTSLPGARNIPRKISVEPLNGHSRKKAGEKTLKW